jgi:hypothetical protein
LEKKRVRMIRRVCQRIYNGKGNVIGKGIMKNIMVKELLEEKEL